MFATVVFRLAGGPHRTCARQSDPFQGLCLLDFERPLRIFIRTSANPARENTGVIV